MLLIKKAIVSLIFLPALGLAGTSSTSARSFVYRDKTYTFDQAMTMQKPPLGIDIVNDDSECKRKFVKMEPISGNTFALIHLAENGYAGMAKSWPLGGGRVTWDTGKYSINESNWQTFIDQGLNPFQLRWNDCASLIASAYLVQKLYVKANEQFKSDIVKGSDPWEALQKMIYTLAGYNSFTPSVRDRYAKRLASMMGVLILKKKDKNFWED